MLDADRKYRRNRRTTFCLTEDLAMKHCQQSLKAKQTSRRIVLLFAALSTIVAVTLIFSFRDVIVEEWNIHRLRSGDPAVRMAAGRTLVELRSAKSIPLFLQEFEKADPLGDVRELSAEQLMARARSTVAADWAAAEALGRLGEIAVPQLVEALKGRDDRVQYFAIRAIGYIGPEARAAVPALLTQLTHADDKNRYAAAQTLAEIGIASDEIVSELIVCLTDKAMWVRAHSASALGNLRAKRGVSALTLTLDDSEDVVRWSAALALVKIGAADGSAGRIRTVLSSALGGGIYDEEAASALATLESRSGGRQQAPRPSFGPSKRGPPIGTGGRSLR